MLAYWFFDCLNGVINFIKLHLTKMPTVHFLYFNFSTINDRIYPKNYTKDSNLIIYWLSNIKTSNYFRSSQTVLKVSFLIFRTCNSCIEVRFLKTLTFQFTLSDPTKNNLTGPNCLSKNTSELLECRNFIVAICDFQKRAITPAKPHKLF